MARAEGLREYSFSIPRRDDYRRREYDTPFGRPSKMTGKPVITTNFKENFPTQAR
jgi:hypothetical protein